MQSTPHVPANALDFTYILQSATVTNVLGLAPAAKECMMSDMDLFLGASAALTGIAQDQLAPALNPTDVPQQYFTPAKTDPNFQKLLQTLNDLNTKKLRPTRS